MDNLTVSIIQESIVWLDPAANREKFADIIARKLTATQLIVLPETFTTGFTQEAAPLAETMEGETVSWMLAQAKKTQAHVTGSFFVSDKGAVFNRLVWATPAGDIFSYDKRHLFSFAGEDKVFAKGQSRLIVDCFGWRVCPLICYDLRFPVWSRNQNDYDVLLYVANWPKARVNHWSQLLVARAIENLSYTIGVNRIGDDGAGYAHNGQSIVLDPKGKPLVEPNGQGGCYTVTLDGNELRRYREKFAALEDRDDFRIL